MSYRFVKRQNSIGWDWCLETYDWSSWVSQPVKEIIESLETENTKLRELLLDVWNDAMQFDGFWDYVNDDGEIYNEDELPHYQERMCELGIEVEQ